MIPKAILKHSLLIKQPIIIIKQTIIIQIWNKTLATNKRYY